VIIQCFASGLHCQHHQLSYKWCCLWWSWWNAESFAACGSAGNIQHVMVNTCTILKEHIFEDAWSLQLHHSWWSLAVALGLNGMDRLWKMVSFQTALDGISNRGRFCVSSYGPFLPCDNMLMQYMLSSLLVCLSVTSQHCTKMAKHRIKTTTPYNSPGTLVFCCRRLQQNSNGGHPKRGCHIEVG